MSCYNRYVSLASVSSSRFVQREGTSAGRDKNLSHKRMKYMAVDNKDFEELNRRKNEWVELRQKHQQLVNAANQEERNQVIPNTPQEDPHTQPATTG